MLIHWQSHQEYLHFLHETKVHLDSSQRTRLRLAFGHVREKLRLLDLDPVMEYLSAFYPPIGRPAKNQVQIFRSLILMVLLRVTSLTAWVQTLKADSLLAILTGSAPDSLPPLGSYFDFMDRLWVQPEASQKTGRQDLFPTEAFPQMEMSSCLRQSRILSLQRQMLFLSLWPLRLHQT